MSGAAVQVFLGRIKLEEGERLKPYDDATAKPVVAPVGNLSWGWGFNLMACGSPGLFRIMAEYLAGDLDKQLGAYSWYAEMDNDPVRQSVLLDIAYNGGKGDLLHYPRMLAAIHDRDWQRASRECRVADANLDASRYAPLRQILLNGDSHV